MLPTVSVGFLFLVALVSLSVYSYFKKYEQTHKILMIASVAPIALVIGTTIIVISIASEC